MYVKLWKLSNLIFNAVLRKNLPKLVEKIRKKRKYPKKDIKPYCNHDCKPHSLPNKRGVMKKNIFNDWRENVNRSNNQWYYK